MKKHIIITLTIILMAITLCGTVSATVDLDDVKYVSSTGSDDNNGNETNPYLTIGKGITSVNPNGTVNVADGTYYEHLIINKNVNLVGQSQENTIIDGSNTGRPIYIDNGAIVSISLFTIRNGSIEDGGAILNSGNLNVTYSTFTNNQANNRGGAIYNEVGSTLNVTDCSFINNQANNGGAILNYMGTLKVADSAFINNYNTFYGCAITNHGGTLNVTDCSFINNQANMGTIIINTEGTLTVTDSTFSNNTGVAIYNDRTLTVTDSTFSNNTDGAIHNNYGTVSMNFNRIVNNSPIAIKNYAGSFDARYNWWGSNNPEFTIISGMVDHNPWLYLTIQANPNIIAQGEKSNLTASFNNAFDGTTITPLNPVNGHIPDKTPVTFNTDLGSVGSKTINKETINGVATATLTADETAGIANVNAVSDSQTVNTNVTIQSNTPTTAKANIKGGLFNGNKSVYLSMNKAGIIYYTRNGSTPTNASTKYAGYLTIYSSTTLKFIAVGSDGTSSPVYTEKYVIDKTAPKVTVTTPTNKATRFSTTSTIVIKFSENIKTSINWSKVYIKNLKTGKKVSIKKLISGNKLNLKMIFKRYHNTWYSVYIPAAAIMDLSGNKMTRAYTYKFKTRS